MTLLIPDYERQGIEGWYNHDGELSDVEKWIVENANFEIDELRDIPRADFTNAALGLIFSRGEDPYIISVVRGMDCVQLRKFDGIGLSGVGFRELSDYNKRWMMDEMYFNGFDERGFVDYEMARDMRLFSEARASFVLHNRERDEVFDRR